MKTMIYLFSRKRFCCLIVTIFFLLVCCAPVSSARAEEVGEAVQGRTMEFNITIQANVLRLCAGGRLYDLIEAESAGDGPSIRPYVVAAVDRKGEPLPCPARSGSPVIPLEALPAD